jgi:hypothetical protein
LGEELIIGDRLFLLLVGLFLFHGQLCR